MLWSLLLSLLVDLLVVVDFLCNAAICWERADFLAFCCLVSLCGSAGFMFYSFFSLLGSVAG